MRVVLVVLVAMLLPACIISKDECNVHGKEATDSLENAATNGVLSVALSGCSTCGHSNVTSTWTTAGNDIAPGETTGYVEIVLSPQCFVTDTTVESSFVDGEGKADGNVKNCGDVVDYAGYVSNRTNATLAIMTIRMECPTLGE